MAFEKSIDVKLPEKVPTEFSQYDKLLDLRVQQLIEAFKQAGLKDDSRYDAPAYMMLAVKIWYVGGFSKELMLKLAEALWNEEEELTQVMEQAEAEKPSGH